MSGIEVDLAVPSSIEAAIKTWLEVQKHLDDALVSSDVERAGVLHQRERNVDEAWQAIGKAIDAHGVKLVEEALYVSVRALPNKPPMVESAYSTPEPRYCEASTSIPFEHGTLGYPSCGNRLPCPKHPWKR